MSSTTPGAKEKSSAGGAIPPATTLLTAKKGNKRLQVTRHSYTADMAQKKEETSTGIIHTIVNKETEIAILNMYNSHQIEGGTPAQFPLKLQIVLKIAQNEGHDHIISWQPHGRAFRIHKPGIFEHEVMTRFFKQSHIASFRRQLNLYGFIRLSSGSDKGAYYHESFLRGRPLLSLGIMKTRIKGNKTPRPAPSLPEDEPQFYQMPFLGPVDLLPGCAGENHDTMRPQQEVRMSAAALARWNRHADNSSTSTTTDTISREDTNMMGGRGGKDRTNICFSSSGGNSSSTSASDDVERTRRLRQVLPSSTTILNCYDNGLAENPGAARRIAALTTLLDETGAGNRIIMMPSMMSSSLPLGAVSDPAGAAGHYTHMLHTSFQQMQQQQQYMSRSLTNPAHPCVVSGRSVPTWILQHRPAVSSSGLLSAAAVHPSRRSSLLLSNNADQDNSFNLESIRQMYYHNAAANQEREEMPAFQKF